MANGKQAALLLVGALSCVGLCLAGAPRDHPAAGDSRVYTRAEVLPSGEAVEIRSQVEQPTAILYAVPAGRTVQKGDLLIELDASALMDKRIQQVVQVRKAETEMILAKESQAQEKQATQGQIVLAEKALHLAQGQLKAFTEGEYPRQLALAQGAVDIGKLRLKLAGERLTRIRAGLETPKDQGTPATLMEMEAMLALEDARLQSEAAENSLSILKSFGHDNRVAELELIVAQREFDLTRAQDALSRANTTGRATMAWAEENSQREKDRLAKMDDQIAKSKVYAPRDGIVAYPSNIDEPPIKAGTVVRDRQVLVRLLPVTPAKP
jgi:HlyD family secretion protein